MDKFSNAEISEVLTWCRSIFGSINQIADHSRVHGGHESSTCRLHTPMGYCFLKIHHSQLHWHNEVHAYERWASAFGHLAPRLLAVREEEPLALVVSEIPGRSMEEIYLHPHQERIIWREAGAALVVFHDLGPGEFFGPCFRDGTPVMAYPQTAEEYVSSRFKRAMERAIDGGYINDIELSTVQAACDLVPSFEGEYPLPCHRDFCAANWLISSEATLVGVIDFEFAHWDVRVADFSRDPDWSWIRRPDLVEAFFEGYGRSLTPKEKQQVLLARAEYALEAILWGRDHCFNVFEQEGREALSHLATLLN